MQTPRWLVGSVVGIVATTAVLSVGWAVSCTFYIGPKIWATYVQTGGKLPVSEPDACKDADNRAILVLTGLLATMLGLMSHPPSGGDPDL
jgi:hypothetical protein